MTQTPDLLSERLDAGVRTLTLGNGRAHALSHGLIRALHAAIDAASADPETRVIVIEGPGHIYCAGHDLKEIARHRTDPDHGRAYLTALFQDCAQMMMAVTLCPKPTVAVVDGIATAAGLQLVAACDLAFASERATVCLPGVANGGFCTTPAVAVSRAVGRKHLMELLLSGESRDADWAMRTGLVNAVLPSDMLAAHVETFARQLATRNPGPIATGKPCTYGHLDPDLAAAYASATEIMIGHFMDPGRIAQEQSSAFAKV